jgi:hypothetical protein
MTAEFDRNYEFLHRKALFAQTDVVESKARICPVPGR